MVSDPESSGQVLEVDDCVAIEPGVPSCYSDETNEGRYGLPKYSIFLNSSNCWYPDEVLFVPPDKFFVKLPENVRYSEGACVERLSVVLHSNQLVEARFDTTVVALGTSLCGCYLA